jgi:hypothetical protein
LPSEQRALISRDGKLQAQAIAWSSFVLAPLHVVDKSSASSFSFLDERGNLEAVTLSDVVAVDHRWDAGMFRTTLATGRDSIAPLVLVKSAGIKVEVHGIVNRPLYDRPTHRLVVHESIIRDIVQVERHSYLAASGKVAIARNIRVIFLAHPFPQGWSGAPVYVKGSYDLIGFIHGNASANSGAGVCLTPHRNSRLLRTLRQFTETEK